VGAFYSSGARVRTAGYARLERALDAAAVPRRVLRRGDVLEDFSGPGFGSRSSTRGRGRGAGGLPEPRHHRPAPDSRETRFLLAGTRRAGRRPTPRPGAREPLASSPEARAPRIARDGTVAFLRAVRPGWPWCRGRGARHPALLPAAPPRHRPRAPGAGCDDPRDEGRGPPPPRLAGRRDPRRGPRPGPRPRREALEGFCFQDRPILDRPAGDTMSEVATRRRFLARSAALAAAALGAAPCGSGRNALAVEPFDRKPSGGSRLPAPPTRCASTWTSRSRR